RPQTIALAGRSFAFAEGDTIHTENSYKYGAAQFEELARAAGWRPLETFVDDERLFSVRVLEAV
ncbi:MAG TPA: L-histidine N(alpha)-methyltransferase, partial [Rhodoblastus sp.]|nr:L-histidine N(alpha)-methyltransferase [Rhodoblastus sp.]